VAQNGVFPCVHGPISAATVPHAEGRDFGNWYPAQLTIEKKLEPAGDPGSFDLLVNGAPVFRFPINGDRITLSDLPPGRYSVREQAVAPTDPSLYKTTVNCRPRVTRFGQFLRGDTFTGLDLVAGDSGTCTVYNVRTGFPAIAARKRGPAFAVAGDTLRYQLLVTNPGDVAFPAASLAVTDDDCDDPPRLVSKRGDTTPETLDPGDRWIYGCSRATTAGADCERRDITNAAAVSAATAAGETVTGDDSIATDLLCPEPSEPTEPSDPEPSPYPQPAPPLPPGVVPLDPPGPQPPQPPAVPGPVAPAAPTPPRAGDVARARLEFRRATQGCLRARVPRVDLGGTRIYRVRIFVNGRLRRSLDVRTLQSRVRPRITLAAGRRYRVTARVAFELGSGTPPLSLTQTVRTCPPQAPRFTG
jgi:hypothetical protein